MTTVTRIAMSTSSPSRRHASGLYAYVSARGTSPRTDPHCATSALYHASDLAMCPIAMAMGSVSQISRTIGVIIKNAICPRMMLHMRMA